MSLKAIFFDAGDTLIHIWHRKQERLAWMCREAGVPVPADPALVRAGCATLERLFQERQNQPDAYSEAWFVRIHAAAQAAMGAPEADQISLAQRVQSTYRRRPPTFWVDPEAAPLLEALRSRGYRLAIVSNWNGTLVDCLRPTGLSGFFEAVLDSRVVGSAKPEVRMFQIACAATGVEPNEAILVGDTPGTDCAGALAAGVRPVLLDSLGLHPDGYPGLPPLLTIASLSELLPLLEQVTAGGI